MKKRSTAPRAWPAAGTAALLMITLLASASVANNTYQTPPFSQNWTNTGLITTNDDWSGVPGIIGYLGDSDPAGAVVNVDPRTLTADIAVAVDVNANRTDAITFATGGVTEFESGSGVRGNPVVALQGSGTADAPFIKLHIDASNMSSVVLSYVLVDVDSSADNAAQQANAQYRIGSAGAWTNITGTYFADVTDGPSLSGRKTPVSVALPPDVAKQPRVEVRIMTTNASGNDEWVGVDDISVTGAPNITDLAIQSLCTTDSTKACTTSVFIGQAWHSMFNVANHGNKPINNWSFDLTLVKQDSTGGTNVIPLKTQVAGNPIPVGGSTTINWPSPYVFTPSDIGPWRLELSVQVKEAGTPDTSLANNFRSFPFMVTNKGGGNPVSDLGVDFVCATDTSKQCSGYVYTNQPWHILFGVANTGAKVIDNWSFDIFLVDSLQGGLVTPLKTHIPGPPLSPGTPSIIINWPSPYIFSSAEKGAWSVVVIARVEDAGNPDADPSNNVRAAGFFVANKGAPTSDLAIQYVCATDTSKSCTNTVYTNQPWHILFSAANYGNKVIDNWSFDILLTDSLSGQVTGIPLKVQVPGPPIPVGSTVTVNWPSPYIFNPSELGPRTVVVRATVKDTSNGDPNPQNNIGVASFIVANKGTGGENSDLAMLFVCPTDSSKQCEDPVFTNQPWHILFGVENHGNKVIDNWSFDILIQDSTDTAILTLALKIQVPGPPLFPGAPMTVINWPSPYIFPSSQTGRWKVFVQATVKDSANPDNNPFNNLASRRFIVANKGAPVDSASDIRIHDTCVTDSLKDCTTKLFFGQEWHTRFTVSNQGQKPVDNWSFDITLVNRDSLGGQVIPVKTQIAGPPLQVGQSIVVNWPGPSFSTGQDGHWRVIVTAVIKDPGNPDTTLFDNRDSTDFVVNTGVTATTLSLFDAESAEDGLLLRWRFVDPSAFAEVGLERGASAGGPWLPIAAERRSENGATVALDREAEPGRTYYYRLVARQPDGSVLTFGPLQGLRGGASAAFALSRVSPNPSFGQTQVDFTLPRDAFVRLVVADVQGREVAVLAEGRYRAGTHQVTWSGQTRRGGASPGLYFVCFKTPDGTMVRRLALTR